MNAAAFSTAVTSDETVAIYRELGSPTCRIKLLYLTPEKLTHSHTVLDILRKQADRGMLARFVIDEAHCISQVCACAVAADC